MLFGLVFIIFDLFLWRFRLTIAFTNLWTLPTELLLRTVTSWTLVVCNYKVDLIFGHPVWADHVHFLIGLFLKKLCKVSWLFLNRKPTNISPISFLWLMPFPPGPIYFPIWHWCCLLLSFALWVLVLRYFPVLHRMFPLLSNHGHTLVHIHWII